MAKSKLTDSPKHVYIDKEAAIEVILTRLAAGESLRAILPEQGRDAGLPAKKTFLAWLTENEELSTQYARAREEGADAKAEEMERLAKDAKDMVDVAKARLIIDARKWNLSKMFPKKYGDRTQVAATDTEGNDKQEHVIIIKSKPKE